MNKFRYVGSDEPLTTEQGAYIKQKAVFAARRSFVGRKLFSGALRKIDAGSQTFGYDTLTEINNASLDYTWPGRPAEDAISLARTTVAIPNLHKEFEINKLDLNASRQTGEPVNTTTAESAAYKVAYLEDTMLLNGYSADGTTYEINGLYQGAGNTDATALDYGTATNIDDSVNNMMALLIADNILPPYNMVLNPTQFMQMNAFIGTTAVTYRQWAEETIGGTVYVSPVITAGKGLMVAARPAGMFEYVLAEDLNVQTEILNLRDGNNLFGKVYLRGLPVIYDSNAICTATSI